METAVELRYYEKFLKVEKEMKGIKFEIVEYIIINWNSVKNISHEKHFAIVKKKYAKLLQINEINKYFFCADNMTVYWFSRPNMY